MMPFLCRAQVVGELFYVLIWSMNWCKILGRETCWQILWGTGKMLSVFFWLFVLELPLLIFINSRFSCVLDDSNLHYVGEKWVMRVKQERCFPPLNFEHSWIPLLHVVLVSCCQVRVTGDGVTATVVVFTVQLWRWSCGCWWHQYTCQFKKYGYSAARFQSFCSVLSSFTNICCSSFASSVQPHLGREVRFISLQSANGRWRAPWTNKAEGLIA